MPATDVVYFQELDRSVPVLEWLLQLAKRDRRAAEKCLAQIEVLRELGHELRRPMADYLRDGIYELRVRVGRSQHRILYFFHGRGEVVLAHGLTKEKKVPRTDVERALVRKRLFEKSPSSHTHREESSDG